MLNIKVLGPGCANCRKLEEIAREAVASLGVAAEIDMVTGIWQARTNFYHSQYDFSSKDYAINKDNATTFERKKRIADDPVWGK